LESSSASINYGNIHWGHHDPAQQQPETYVLPQGCESIVSSLAKGLDIRFEHQVQKIEYNIDITEMTGAKNEIAVHKGVRIITDKGNLEGDVALITLPTGVLKEGLIKFHPPLPEWKASALQQLGCGLIDKMVLVFEHAFWDDKLSRLGVVSGRQGWMFLFESLSKPLSIPVLVIYFSGKSAAEMEKEDNDQLIQEALTILRRVYSQVPLPKRALVSQWHLDPLARGAFTFPLEMTSEATASEQMSLPIQCGDTPLLFFAGEGTVGYNTEKGGVERGYLSGMREALNIAKCLQINKSLV